MRLLIGGLALLAVAANPNSDSPDAQVRPTRPLGLWRLESAYDARDLRPPNPIRRQPADVVLFRKDWIQTFSHDGSKGMVLDLKIVRESRDQYGWMDVTVPAFNLTIKCLYRFDGTRLQIASLYGGELRPRGFAIQPDLYLGTFVPLSGRIMDPNAVPLDPPKSKK
jgi:hypothetical protein